MANTGYKQAVIAYKVDAKTGDPLDINGRRIAETGRKQAIYLLLDTPNPDPSRYEVQGYFTQGQQVQGIPTRDWRPDECRVGVLRVSPWRVVLHPSDPPTFVSVFSGTPWTIDAGSSALVTLSPTSGGEGETLIEVTPTGVEGFFDYTINNGQLSETLRVIVAADWDLWVLTDGTWHDSGFWKPDGIWQY